MSKKTPKTKVIFDASSYDYQMRNNKLTCGFNMPEALSGDSSFGLPPYAKRMPYLVDEYPACPEKWMRSEGRTKSFFVPVEEGKGMWLDFNECNNHTHNVAIVISIQGINPITGLPCNDPQLEQYIDECPKHKVKFGPDRYCKKCNFRWPKQNYICTTATPGGQFWIDGFKAADGIVRQYILTAEKMRGVASNVIGKDRVYAIGISFFLSKEKKPESSMNILRSCSSTPFGYLFTHSPPVEWNHTTSSGGFGDANGNNIYKDICENKTEATYSYLSCANSSDTQKGIVKCGGIGKGGARRISSPSIDIKEFDCTRSLGNIRTKKLEVGAGAKINQVIYDDTEGLDFWHNEPEAITCINYCSEKECRAIIEQGRVDIKGNAEGFLQDVPVGN